MSRAVWVWARGRKPAPRGENWRPEEWSGKDGVWSPTRDYYASATLEAYNAESLRGMARFLVFFGVVAAAVLVGAFRQTGGYRTFLFSVAGAIGIVLSWGLALLGYKVAAHLDRLLAVDDAQGRQVREALALKIREFAERQNRYKGLMTMHENELRAWLIDSGGYYEVRDQWPQDFDEYAALVREPYYGRVVEDLYLGPDSRTATFEKIIKKREDIYEWATRKTTPEERAKATIQRQAEILTYEKIMERRMHEAVGPPPAPRFEEDE